MKKKKKGKSVYAAISLISSIFPIVGGITGAISWWNSMNNTAESEHGAAQFEHDQLLSSIKYAQEILSTCGITAMMKSELKMSCKDQ